MKKWIIYVILIFVLIVGIILINFKTNNKESKDLQKITLAEVTHSVFYTPMYVAIEKGYFKEQGLEIELLLTPGADKVSAAVLSGDAQIGFAGAESAMYVYQAGEDDYLKIFAGLTKRDGQFIIGREKTDFDWNDLKGKEILVGRISGMPALNFLNALKNVGIDKNDITINSSVDFASLSGAFIGGEGDYVNLFEPNATSLEQQSYGFVLDSIGKLSGEFPYTVFYSKKSYLDNNKELLTKFTSAINKGLKYTQDNDADTIAKTISNQFSDLDLDNLSIMIKRYKDYDCWLNNPFISETLYNNLKKFLIENKLLNKEVPYIELVNNYANK